MTYEEYIKNPMGKGSAAFGSRRLQIRDFADRWVVVRLREQNPPVHYLYKTKDDEEYIAHFKIPSEVVPKFYYDVIVRFFPPKDNGNVRNHKNLLNYSVQFFSNDPSFAYTYEHAFFINNLFFKDLIPKANPIFLKERAVEKNPRDEIGYVKSLCFMYFDIKDLKLFDKSSWARAKVYDKIVWKGTVQDTISKIKDRQNLNKADVKRHRSYAAKSGSKPMNPLNKIKDLFRIPENKGFANVNNSVLKQVNFNPKSKREK